MNSLVSEDGSHIEAPRRTVERGRRSLSGVHVGVERVLYLAASESEFREALLVDPSAAVHGRGLELSDGELGLLRAIPAARLRQTILGLDLSPENVERRTFMRIAAAGAMTVAAGQAFACSDDVDTGVRPDYPDSSTTKDGGTDHLMGTGIRPDISGPNHAPSSIRRPPSGSEPPKKP